MAVAVALEASAALQAEPCHRSAGSPGTSSGSSASDQSRFGPEDAAEGERGWSGLRETRWPWPKKLSALLSACSGNLGARSADACGCLALLRLGFLASCDGDLGIPQQPSPGICLAHYVYVDPQKDTLKERQRCIGTAFGYSERLQLIQHPVQESCRLCAQHNMSLTAGSRRLQRLPQA